MTYTHGHTRSGTVLWQQNVEEQEPQQAKYGTCLIRSITHLFKIPPRFGRMSMRLVQREKKSVG